MNKRIPSRNSRSKGIKVKHVLQICLLLVVFFWLVYQVKRSHEKESDESDAKATIKAQGADEVLKFGRKDLHPHVQEASKNEKHKEDEELESVGPAEINREEENKHEQEEQEDDEEETKHEGEHKGGSKREEEDREDENDHEEGDQDETKDEETEDEGRGGDDDDIDESNKEKKDGKNDGEEEFIEEEKETEDVGEEKESESNEAEGKEQVDNEKSLEDQDHGGNSHEAREENYRADDASSAVTHDNPTTSTEGEKVGLENSAKNDLEQENKSSQNGAHEAQEEHYKAGDASSAATHDNPIRGTESERVNSENSNANLASIDLVQENKTHENNAYNVNVDQNNSTLHLEQGVLAENVIPGYNKDSEVGLANTGDKLPPENTTSLISDQRISSGKHLEVSTEAGDNPRGASTNPSDLSQKNEMPTISNPIHAQNSSVDGATIGEVSNLKYTKLEHTNNTESDNSQSDTKAVSFGKPEAINTIARASLNSSSNSVSDASDKTNKSEVEAEADANANAGSSSIMKEVTGASLNENSKTNNESSGANEDSDSFATDETGAADKHDQIDSSDTLIGQDETEARMYLDTLPKDIVGGVNSRDVAAE